MHHKTHNNLIWHNTYDWIGADIEHIEIYNR